MKKTKTNPLHNRIEKKQPAKSQQTLTQTNLYTESIIVRNMVRMNLLAYEH